MSLEEKLSQLEAAVLQLDTTLNKLLKDSPPVIASELIVTEGVEKVVAEEPKPAKKKAAKKATKKKAAKKKEVQGELFAEGEEAPVTVEDVTIALTELINCAPAHKENEAKDRARGILDQFGAINMSTLSPENYAEAKVMFEKAAEEVRNG